MSNVPVSSTEIEVIHQESLKDPTLTVLRHYINMGWPSDRRNLPKNFTHSGTTGKTYQWKMVSLQRSQASNPFHTKEEGVGTDP